MDGWVYARGRMGASGKRKVVGIRRKRLPNGKYLQLYVLEGRGPRGGRTVGYVLTKKGTPPSAASSSAPAGGATAAPSSGTPAVIVKRKRHAGNGPRSRGR